MPENTMKNTPHIRPLTLIIALLFILLASSCTSEYHYANSYLRKFKHHKKTATEKIYVCLPTTVYHTNSSLNDIADFDYLPTNKQDSIISTLTKILDKINDSLFLDQFNNSLLHTLSRTRIPIVLVDNPSQMPKTSPQTLTLHIPQLEAEEFLQRTRSDFYTQKGTYYAYDYDLRHFATNAWFIFDNTDTTHSVYFKSNEIQETFQGTVTSIRDKKASINAHFDRITPNDAYRTARDLGAHCAELYIEKILTEYVKSQTGKNDWYFIYNHFNNEINIIIPYTTGITDTFEKL